MTDEETREVMKQLIDNIEVLDMAIKALVKLEKIQEIINIDNSVIQEDVMKYKMICEVVADDT